MRKDAHVGPLQRRGWIAALMVLLLLPGAAHAADVKAADASATAANGVVVTEAQKIDASKPDAPANLVNRAIQLPDLTKRENVSAAMELIVLLTVLSLAP